MRRPWFRTMALLTLAAVMALGGVASGAGITFTEVKLAGGALNQTTNPETQGATVVWTHRNLVGDTLGAVAVHDLADHSTTYIGSGDSVVQRNADVSLGRVAYEVEAEGDTGVQVWDSWLDLYTTVADTADDEVLPRISNNLVVWYVPAADELRYRDLWRGYTGVVPGAHDIEYWDVDNGCIMWSFEQTAAQDQIHVFRPGVDTASRMVRYTLGDLDISSVQLHGTSFAYTVENADGEDTDAYFGDFSGSTTMIGCVASDSNAHEERDPAVFHREVVWQTDMIGTNDLFLRSIIPFGGDISRIAGGATDADEDRDPSIFGHRIAYEYLADGSLTPEIWLSVADPDVARTAGDDRYLTAIETSKAYFRAADNVVLCTGLNFPDALAAAPLARLLGAPLLLTRTDALDEATMAELERLSVKNVYVIGGSDVVSDDVMSQIASTLVGVTAHRIYGDDRYETSAAIAEEMATRLSGVYSVRRAFFARGDNFPDALAVGPVAAGALAPIILVRTGEVPAVVATAVDDLDLTSGVIVGGSDVVTDGVKSALRTLMIDNGGDDMDPMIVERWSGDTRYETAIAIVEHGLEWRVIDLDTLGFATGYNFPDALGGGAALGVYGSPLLLTTPDALPTSVDTFFDDHVSEIGRIDIFGGEDVVGEAVRSAILSNLD